MKCNSHIVYDSKKTLFAHELLTNIIIGKEHPKVLIVEADHKDSWQCEPLSQGKSKNNIASFQKFCQARSASQKQITIRDYFVELLQHPSSRSKAMVHYYLTHKQTLYLQDGMNFSVDFVGYSKKPENDDQHKHSLYCIAIDDGTFTWATLQKYIKISHNMKKTLMVVKLTADPATVERYFMHELWSDKPPSIDSLFSIQSAFFKLSSLK